ncbi:antibiotic biosynthesis monooxygenase [Aeromonas caviae]|uniref:putative quinol monooxygenase n=1 Tax=Aeromonas caviae TaxID=648 RepID=UPI0019212D71|nr:antibiotic biosynthesis monooxygenase [Aeromonas caviae]MBL0576872.1 antibiotic biosynthesis monooxygenase [Aeromonas caviae]
MMNLFEINIMPDRGLNFDEVARKTISASVNQETGTLAMYAMKHRDDARQAYMIELYASDYAYRHHLDGEPYKAFSTHAPNFINQKKKITLVPQFLGDKHIVQNEKTINNLVVVEVKPEFQAKFKNIVLPEMAKSLEIEKGVLAMYAATDVKNPYRWYFYEIYASQEDYQLHRKTPHFSDYLTQTANMSVSKKSISVKPVFLRNKGGINFEE